MSRSVYLGFGSNLGDRQSLYREALSLLDGIPDSECVSRSRLYEAEPVGLTDGGGVFLNGAVGLDTGLGVFDLMDEICAIEMSLGKSRDHASDRSRPIDLDLLLYGEERIDEDGLQVPHPRMHIRAFVLAPLSEIAGDVVHPVFGKKITSLLRSLPEQELRTVRLLESRKEW